MESGLVCRPDSSAHSPDHQSCAGGDPGGHHAFQREDKASGELTSPSSQAEEQKYEGIGLTGQHSPLLQQQRRPETWAGMRPGGGGWGPMP